MHELQLALERDGELREQIDRVSRQISENQLKHALVLDLNPFWDACRRLEAAGLRPDAYRWWSCGIGPSAPFPIPMRSPGPADLSMRYKVADDLTDSFFGSRKRKGPYLLRILAAPVRTEEERRLRYQLVQAARQASIPTVVETEERATYVAGPGDALTAGSRTGTLGGFLRDGAFGQAYAVTCGHVVSTGSVSTSAGILGSCVHAAVPVQLPAVSVCTTGCVHMTKLDVALVDVGTATVTNVATSAAQIVARGDSVEMHGGVSGKQDYEVGGIVIEIDIAGSCWDRLYLLHAPTSGLLPISVKVATHPLPKPGDSGAWLLRNANEWAGMVVATASLHAYALPSSVVLTEANRAFGTHLQLV